MRIGSLFSGIGGLEKGLEDAGVGHTVWQVERDPFCRQVLARHWPDAVRHDDVRTVGAHNLEPVDVICGGFPCQDISYAGKGAGLAGERSGLWYEFARIVGEMGPRYVVVENVAALLTRGLDAVLGTLADLGYDAEWECIRAEDVGIPQARPRLFIVAFRPPTSTSALLHQNTVDVTGHRSWIHGSRARQANTDNEGSRASAMPLLGNAAWPEIPNGERSGDDGRIPSGLDHTRYRTIGNSVVPQVAEVVGRRLLEIDAALSSEVAA